MENNKEEKVSEAQRAFELLSKEEQLELANKISKLTPENRKLVIQKLENLIASQGNR